MKLIIAIIKPFKVAEVVDAVGAIPMFPGMTVFAVQGFGSDKTSPHEHTRAEDLHDFTDHTACIVAASDDQAETVVEHIQAIAHTGQRGDGKIFVLDLDQAVRIGSGERGELALA